MNNSIKSNNVLNLISLVCDYIIYNSCFLLMLKNFSSIKMIVNKVNLKPIYLSYYTYDYIIVLSLEYFFEKDGLSSHFQINSNKYQKNTITYTFILYYTDFFLRLVHISQYYVSIYNTYILALKNKNNT